jgi:F420-dependent oxidoreductase-like protein
MQLAIMIEGQDGLNWERWKRLAKAAEDFGFAGLYRSDHYTNPYPPEKDSLELWVSLTWLATNTKRIKLGPLVTPFSFREPTTTARMAAAVDDLSGGRLVLGLGAGWNEREHAMFGLPLLELGPRMKRFKEGLDVVTLLLQGDKPVDYSGEFYKLKEAILLPRPQRKGGPEILVGGSGKRTLRYAAKYAAEWNGTSQGPATFREHCAQLDHHLKANGRKPSDLRRSAMNGIFFGRNKAEVERATAFIGMSPDDLRARNRLVGEPDEIVQKLGELAAAGCQQVMLQWLNQDDIDGLEAIAKLVMPQVKDL